MGFYDTFTRVNPGDTLAYLKISEHRNRNNSFTGTMFRAVPAYFQPYCFLT